MSPSGDIKIQKRYKHLDRKLHKNSYNYTNELLSIASQKTAVLLFCINNKVEYVFVLHCQWSVMFVLVVYTDSGVWVVTITQVGNSRVSSEDWCRRWLVRYSTNHIRTWRRSRQRRYYCWRKGDTTCDVVFIYILWHVFTSLAAVCHSL